MLQLDLVCLSFEKSTTIAHGEAQILAAAHLPEVTPHKLIGKQFKSADDENPRKMIKHVERTVFLFKEHNEITPRKRVDVSGLTEQEF